MNAGLIRFLSEGTTESSRRLIAYRCAMVLLIIDTAMAAVICYQGMNFKPVDNGLLTAFGALNLIIAGLAREIFHRRNEVGAAAPPATENGVVSERPAMDGSAKIKGQP